MQTIRDKAALGALIDSWKSAGERIAFVPTMGALHAGHMALVAEARRRAPRVAVSIFVNPMQFGAGEDLDRYPRREQADARMLADAGVDLLWLPPVEAMYPAGFATKVSVTGVSDTLDGAARPGHFDGVATVVTKLFNQVRADVALFGEKDFQQLAVIRAMARDLDLTRPHVDSIIGVPTVREADGLAMSSRNRYLALEQRAAAAALPQAMQAAAAAIEGGGQVAGALKALETAILGAGFTGIDYATLVDAASLAPLDRLGESPARLLVAARIGGTRLIDNLPVNRNI